MSSIANDHEFFDAALTALLTTDLLVGDAVKPAGVTQDAQQLPTTPYLIMYPMPSGGITGTMGNPHDDEDLVVQVTSVGRTREAAQWASDKAKAVMLAGFPIPGRALMGPARMDVGAGVRRDDDTALAPLFYSVSRYRFPTTPTADEES